MVNVFSVSHSFPLPLNLKPLCINIRTVWHDWCRGNSQTPENRASTKLKPKTMDKPSANTVSPQGAIPRDSDLCPRCGGGGALPRSAWDNAQPTNHPQPRRES